MTRETVQRAAMFAGSVCLVVETLGFSASLDPRWLAAGAMSGLGVVALLVLAGPRRGKPIADDPFEGTPGLIDSRTGFAYGGHVPQPGPAATAWYWRRPPEGRVDLERAFAALDRELAHPARLRRRLACARARQRDRVCASTEERVAWIGLWTQLEDDDGMAGVSR